VRTDVTKREDCAFFGAAQKNRLPAQHLAAHRAKLERRRKPGHVPKIGKKERFVDQTLEVPVSAPVITDARTSCESWIPLSFPAERQSR
jgi:hypothetical protein